MLSIQFLKFRLQVKSVSICTHQAMCLHQFSRASSHKYLSVLNAHSGLVNFHSLEKLLLGGHGWQPQNQRTIRTQDTFFQIELSMHPSYNHGTELFHGAVGELYGDMQLLFIVPTCGGASTAKRKEGRRDYLN